MESLSIAQKQMVMIAKALSKNARVIVLDEPTAMLNEQEVHTLFQIIGSLRKRASRWYTFPTEWKKSIASATG